MTCVELEREIAKIVMAMMTRNIQIGQDLISHLNSQLSTEAAAGVIIICIERVLWLDPSAVIWTIAHLLPVGIRQEIQKTFLVHFYKHLIFQGFLPGKDFSVDGNSQLLLNSQAKLAIFGNSKLKNIKST
ncbi:hypothetical protein [Gloeocapsopsis sp. IPPAS B-1203]|uniref:hypothetical protein n=1 Tax=Gloeocapsopsis sp. IPPAS B-1203 TaxID=2049454 RepID=UPI000C17566E|nr:hypothetical protein [Gloeocapsopsis sp. IPPAS B-1203]PIG92649.1 hypothetical protein CSQ79_13755 [Gloeocapsopsis sp. IPPAS B-1203]